MTFDPVAICTSNFSTSGISFEWLQLIPSESSPPQVTAGAFHMAGDFSLSRRYSIMRNLKSGSPLSLQHKPEPQACGP